MSFLFVGSTGDNAGHTLLTWAILRRLTKIGLRVGFMKPFGTRPTQVDGQWTDQDAVLFKEVLGLSEPLGEICPFPNPRCDGNETETIDFVEDLKRSIEALSKDKDVLVIMGSRHIFFDEPSRPLPDISLVPLLGADFVLIHRHRQISKSLYSILSVCSLLRENMRGIIFNRVPPDAVDLLRERVLPSLVQKGVPALAALPEDPFLSFRSLREIKEVLCGEVLCGEQGLERPVASMTVGSHDLPLDLMLFKRVYNKIVLLSHREMEEGDAEMNSRPLAGILITGGRHPAAQLIEAARKESIPLVLIKDDTFAALERLEQNPSVLSKRDEMKIRRFTELLDRENGLDSLIGRLRLRP
ncbi:MAG: phosphotransacetylase family protein [Desulfobacteraceae bacterium]|nr:MAG: phosphotransacetylase family protein [Desulfobacteraceae bacterium]